MNSTEAADWSSESELRPQKSRRKIRLLIVVAVVLTVFLVGGCLGLLSWVIVAAAPSSVIQGGKETAEMRMSFEKHGLLESDESLLRCYFDGQGLDDRGCILTDRRIGVFGSKLEKMRTWGSPVVSYDYAEVRFIEVTRSNSSARSAAVRVHKDEDTWLQFELGGRRNQTRGFLKDLERMCVEHAGEQFEGLTEREEQE